MPAGRARQRRRAGRRHPPGDVGRRACRTAARPRRRRRRRTIAGIAAPSGSRRCWPIAGARGVISDRLLALVRCPECRAHADRATGDRVTCSGCGRRYRGSAGDFLDLRPSVEFAEQTKYLDEALHADARHERVSPPLLGSKIRNDMLRDFLAPGPADRVVDLGCGSGRALLWNRDWRAHDGRHRHRPFFARGGARAASICCSAICAGCRSRTARSPRRTRSTCSSTCRPRRCAACWPRRRACSRRAARCSSTRTSARTRRSPSGCAGSTRWRGGSSASA